jgi:hypothetical protein
MKRLFRRTHVVNMLNLPNTWLYRDPRALGPCSTHLPQHCDILICILLRCHLVLKMNGTDSRNWTPSIHLERPSIIVDEYPCRSLISSAMLLLPESKISLIASEFGHI